LKFLGFFPACCGPESAQLNPERVRKSTGTAHVGDTGLARAGGRQREKSDQQRIAEIN